MEHDHAWRSFGPRKPLRCVICCEPLILSPVQKRVVEAAVRDREHRLCAEWRTINVLIAKGIAYSLAGSGGDTGSTSFSNASYLLDEFVANYGTEHR